MIIINTFHLVSYSEYILRLKDIDPCHVLYYAYV